MEKTKGGLGRRISGDDEFSLMLSTESPPRRSYSPTFILQDPETADSKKILSKPSSQKSSAAFAACIKRLFDNGGAYNSTQDKDFTDSTFSGTLNDAASGWEVTVSKTGSTSATLLTEGDGTENLSLPDLGLNLITNTSMGAGAIALGELNKNGSAIGLYLGNQNCPGHVVMGGYNTALIDSKQGSVVYSKQGGTAGQFEVYLSEIRYISGDDGEGAAPADGIPILVDKTLRLSYNSPTTLLPEAILAELLPHLNTPIYDEKVNGYVYSSSAKTDYSLMFTLTSNTSEGSIVRITVPASSLLMQEPDVDNPLTGGVIESGRQYLLFAPLRVSSSDQGIGYLGRAFLKHIYMVDDNSQFFISAVNTTAAASKVSNVTLDASELMRSTPVDISPISTKTSTPPDNSKGKKNSTKLVGAIVGGLVGGIAVIWLIVLFFYFRRRRAQTQLTSQDGDFEVNSGDKEIENEIYAASNLGGGRQGTRKVVPQTGDSIGRTVGETNVLPTPTNRSTKKAVLASSSELSRIEEGMPAPSGSTRFFTGKTHRHPLPGEQHASGSLPKKRFSEPAMRHPEYPFASKKKRYQSSPVLAREHMTSGPYKHFLRENNGTEDLQATQHIISYHQLLAHHRAHRRHASYLDSESSNGNDTSTITTTTSNEATVGKVIAKGHVGRVRQVSPTPPHVVLANSLERRASIGRVASLLERRASVGRVILPGEVVIVPPSRRTSRTSRELLNSPKKSPGAAASSAGGGGKRIGRGHRRGKSAPSDLGFPSKPGLPLQRAKDDSFVAGVKQTLRPTPSTHSAPVPTSSQLIGKGSVGTFLFEDSPSDSSSSTALPPRARLVSGSGDKPEDPDNISREERRGSPSHSVDTTVAAPLADPVIDQGGSWLAGAVESINETASIQD